MNRTLAFVAGIAAIAIAAVVGLGTLLPRNQPGAGATGGTTAPSASPRPGAHLGPLAAGAYAALKFEPGLLFEVPAGWVVVADDASTLILRGPGTASTYCPTDQPSSCRHVENVIDVTANRLLGSDASDCEGLARQDSPRTASEMVAALSSDPRLSTSSGRPVTIGGLTGTALTVQLRSSWTGTCKWSAGAPAALVLTAADPPGPFFGLMGPEVVDLVLLDSSDGVISLTSDPFYRTASQPIVRTFVFGGR